MKKFFLILGVIMNLLVIGSICFAAETGEVIGSYFENTELLENKTMDLDVYRDQNVKMTFYYGYNNSNEIPSGAGLFLVIKDEKNVPIDYYSLYTDFWRNFKGTSRSASEQEFKISEDYKSNKKYTLEVYDKIDVTEKGLKNSKPKYIYKFKLDIKEHEHKYNVKNLTCACGNKFWAGTTHDDISNIDSPYLVIKDWKAIEKLQFSLVCSDLKFYDGKDDLDEIILEINAMDSNYKKSFSQKINNYVNSYKRTKVQNSEEQILINPSTHDASYYYDFHMPEDIPNGKLVLKIKIGDYVVQTFYTKLELPNVEKNIKFTDLPKSHWAYNNIMVLADHGVISGYSDGTFKPEETVTREEFVQMLYRADLDSPQKVQFVDVLSDRWSYNACNEYGYPLAVFNGNEMYFLPGNVITRQEVAKLLVMVNYLYGNDFSKEELIRLAPYIENTAKKFNDLDSANEYMPYIYSAVEHKLMNGVSEVEFNPTGSLTRAQAATLIYRIKYFYEYYEEDVEEEKVHEEKNGMLPVGNTIEKIREKLPNGDNWGKFENNGKAVYYYIFSNNTVVNSAMITDGNASDNRVVNQSQIGDFSKYITSVIYIPQHANAYGFKYELDEAAEKCTFMFEYNGKTYYSESEYTGTSIKVDGMYNMIGFIILNANSIDGCSASLLEEIDVSNEIGKFISKYKGKSNLYYGEKNVAQLKVDNKQITITYKVNGQNKKVVITQDSHDLLSDETIKELQNIFGFGYLKGSDNIVEYAQKYVEVNVFTSTQNAECKNIYGMIAYILNNNEVSNKKIAAEETLYDYNLKFEDIITSTSVVKEENAAEYVKTKVGRIIFDRTIKNLDFDIIDSKNESVLYYINYGNEGTVYNNKIFFYSQIKPGEKYKIVMKNFIDENNRATPKDEEYIIEFSSTGEQLTKFGNEITNLKFDVPEQLKKDSVISISVNGDLKGREKLILAVGPFQSGGRRIVDVEKLSISVQELYDIMYYDDVAPGDKVEIEASIQEYTGGTNGGYKNKELESVIITMP